MAPGLLAQMNARFGPEASGRLLGWQQFVEAQGGVGEGLRLWRVNLFLNRVPFVEDAAHWGLEDYWATPAEFVASRGGDCEDFAIAKLFTLQALELPTARLRLMYVNALTLNQAHMVLLYTPYPGAMPLVLDNLTNTVVPATQRKDLEPVYSFNSSGLWLEPDSATPRQVRDHSGSLLWEDLRRRLQAQGLDI
ncbi:sulfate adenylyltransferase [Microbulbifer flavimaris]|uniref:Sulfate adenylyltransferase n=2 Tax=Microbulbiferaceae TaxID=1706373 RepID=A0ABX4HXP1_9GAMM|nr:sulfate adenylyltransferase [Microbulbifer flavimaris]